MFDYSFSHWNCIIWGIPCLDKSTQGVNYCRLHPISKLSIKFLLLSLITTLVSNCYPIVRHNHKHYVTQQYILYIMLQDITPYHCRIVNMISHYIASINQPYAEMINLASFQCCFFFPMRRWTAAPCDVAWFWACETLQPGWEGPSKWPDKTHDGRV